MKKILTIIVASLLLILVVLYVVGEMLEDKKGMIYIVSSDPDNNSTIRDNQEISLEIWYLIWKYSPQVDYFVSYGYATDNGYSLYQMQKIIVPDQFGKVSVKTNIADVKCGIHPIVRESNSREEIGKKIFDEVFKTGSLDNKVLKQLQKLTSCKYKNIKYPFELKATLNYEFKKQKFGFFGIDTSNIIQFKVDS